MVLVHVDVSDCTMCIVACDVTDLFSLHSESSHVRQKDSGQVKTVSLIFETS